MTQMAEIVRFESHTPEADADLLEHFRTVEPPQDCTLWRKRNCIWTHTAADGSLWAVKRFADSWLIRMIYSIRESKASRSYRFATELQKRGIHTPAPVCFAEWRGRMNRLLASVYVSQFEPSLSLHEALEKAADRTELLHRLACFFVRMHRAGFIHTDANLTNVRMSADGDFGVIDLNRMKVYPEGTIPPAEVRLFDLCQWSSLDDDFRTFARFYVEESDDPEITFGRAIEIKIREGRNVDRRKWPKRTLRSLKKTLFCTVRS